MPEPEKGDILISRRRKYVVKRLVAGIMKLKDARTGREALANYQLVRWDERAKVWRPTFDG